MTLDDFDAICTDVFKIPKICKKLLFERIKEFEKLDVKMEKIGKQNFINYYKHNCEGIDLQRHTFNLLAKMGKHYIEPEDFKPLFKHLLESHPGLEFL